jgi:hypothetical protein
MTFDYSFVKEVRVNMWDYLRNVVKEFPEGDYQNVGNAG